MENLLKFINNVPWGVVLVLCLTLGLAPFRPPHIWEKLTMLARGELHRPIDIFDLFLHGTPWILLLCKLLLMPWRMK